MTPCDDGQLTADVEGSLEGNWATVLGEIRPDARSVELRHLRKQAAELLGIGAELPPDDRRFEVIRRLGAGGMGVVYLARDRHLDREVALKFLRPGALGIGSPQEHRVTLREEARAAAAISHPNLVEVYDVGEIDGQIFMAMNDVRGERLSAWSTAERTAQELAATFGQIARAVHALHEAGLVHGDLKPANVIVAPDGHATLVDYGLARRHEPDTLEDDAERSRTGGTPGYLAPELVGGESPTPRTDQYAFGVALKESLARCRDTLPRYLGDTAARATARDPAQRFASMQAVAEALRPPAHRSYWIGAVTIGVLGLVLGAAMIGDRKAAPQEAPVQAASVSSDAVALLGAGATAEVQGRYVAAQTALAESFSVAQRDDDAATQAAAASALVAITGAHLRRPRDAEQWRRHAEAALARIGDPAETTAVLLASRARSALANADFGGAVDLAEQSLVLHSDPSTMRVLGSALEERGFYDEAEAWHREALALLSHDDPEAGTATAALGKVQHSRRDETLARLFYEEALAIYGETLGPEHPLIAVVLGRLGMLAGATGDIAFAESNHRRALEIRSATLGEGHPAVAESLTFLAGALKRQRRFDEARSCYEKAIAILETELGANNGDLAVTLGGLSDVLVRSGALEDATKVLERTIALRRVARGPAHPRVATDLSMLANVQRKRHDYDGALRSEREALSIRLDALGEDHPLVERSRERVRATQERL